MEKHAQRRLDCPEIFAFSAESTARLSAQVRSALSDLKSFGIKSVPGAKTRDDFDPDAGFRLLALARNRDKASETLEAGLNLLENPDSPPTDTQENLFFGTGRPEGGLAFMFPGQGSQYPLMGLGLAETFKEAASVLREADRNFAGNRLLSELIYPVQPTGNKKPHAEMAAKDLQETEAAQPAIGAVSLMMLNILRRLALEPAAACGHSFGELTALCAAGRIQQRDFMKLAAARGRFMAEAGRAWEDSGAMLAVKAPAERIMEIIYQTGGQAVIANLNSPEQNVVSGPTVEIENIQRLLKKKRIVSSILPVSAAFHSRLVTGAAGPFSRAVAATPFYRGSFPVYSNTTAGPYPEDAEEARSLLGSHLLNPVDFIGGIKRMHEDGIRTFLEVGPGAVLTGLVKKILSGMPHSVFSADSSGARQPDRALFDLAAAACRAAAMGYMIELGNWPFSQKD